MVVRSRPSDRPTPNARTQASSHVDGRTLIQLSMCAVMASAYVSHPVASYSLFCLVGMVHTSMRMRRSFLPSNPPTPPFTPERRHVQEVDAEAHVGPLEELVGLLHVLVGGAALPVVLLCVGLLCGFLWACVVMVRWMGRHRRFAARARCSNSKAKRTHQVLLVAGGLV